MKVKRLLITIGALVLLIGGIIGIMQLTGLNTLEKIQSAVLSGGILSYLIYFALTFIFMLGQFLTTALVIIAGVYAFGLWQGIILGISAVLIGAIGLFFLGKFYGVKVVKWVAGKEDISKWQKKLTQGKYTLFLLLLLPISPDSLLYCLMGTSGMKFTTFLTMILLSKPIGVVFTALFGGGAIIPITWQWAWLWAILGVIMIAFMYYSYKYQDKIDKAFSQLFKKHLK